MVSELKVQLWVGICASAKKYHGSLEGTEMILDTLNPLLTFTIKEVLISEESLENQKTELLQQSCHFFLDLQKIPRGHATYLEGKSYVLYLDIVDIVNGQVLFSEERGYLYNREFRRSSRKRSPSTKEVLKWIQVLLREKSVREGAENFREWTERISGPP